MIVLIATATLIASCGRAPTAMKYTSYTNKTLGIAVDIPQGWDNISESPEAPLFDSPDGSMSVGMALIPNPARRKPLDFVDLSDLFYEVEVLESRTDLVIQGHEAAMTRFLAKGRRDIEEFKNLEVVEIHLAIELKGNILFFCYVGDVDKAIELVRIYRRMVSTIEFLND